MTRKCQVRFGGGRLQKGSNTLHLGSLLPYQGSVSSSQVRVGEVFQAAVARTASSIVICHNHPSGDPTPSPDDVAVTRAMVQAGKLLDITLLDHLVIGQAKWVSLKERGLGFEGA